jgi:hypothetical protein
VSTLIDLMRLNGLFQENLLLDNAYIKL